MAKNKNMQPVLIVLCFSLSSADMLQPHQAFLLLLPSQFGQRQFFYAETTKSQTPRRTGTHPIPGVFFLPVLQLQLIGNFVEQVVHSTDNLSNLGRYLHVL